MPVSKEDHHPSATLAATLTYSGSVMEDPIVIQSIMVVLRIFACLVGAVLLLFSVFLSDSGRPEAILCMYVMMLQAALLIGSGVFGLRILFLLSMALLCSFLTVGELLGRVNQATFVGLFVSAMVVLFGLAVWFEIWWRGRNHCQNPTMVLPNANADDQNARTDINYGRMV
jgi:hypothetical protein